MENHSSLTYEQCLKSFFSEVPPEELKKTILYIYLNFLIHIDLKDLPKNFNLMAEDIFVITELLDEMNVIRSEYEKNIRQTI